MKKVLITGANGQLGRALAASVPDDYQAVVADRQVLNISDVGSVNAWINDHSPEGIINAAAYTAVDKAETESDLAKAANTDGPKIWLLLLRNTAYLWCMFPPILYLTVNQARRIEQMMHQIR